MARQDNDWSIDAKGLLPAARFVSSPNYDPRPPGSRIELVVIHNISLPPGCFGSDDIQALFTNCLDPSAHPYFRDIADMRVSSHFLIRRNGEVIQFVSCNARAWHAGASCWQGQEACNDFSVGIELEGSDDVVYEDAQYETLQKLVDALCSAYPIRDCVGHSDIAVPTGRKTDPGPHFEWARLDALRRFV